MARKSMIQAINDALHIMMTEDESVLVLGQDVGEDGGVFRATVDLIEKYGPERVVDMPLAESLIVGSAIGMAMNGLKPVAEIQFMGFIYQGFDQTLCHAARYRHRSRGRFGLPMVVRAPYGAGVRALEHHSESTEVHFASVPGLKVVIPSTAYDAKGLLISAIEDPDPVMFFEPKRLYRLKKEEVPSEKYTITIGKAHIAREGADITIIAWGGMMPIALAAAEHVADEGVEAEVIDLRTIQPFDVETITASVAKTGRLVIVHEAPRLFGPGAEIATQVYERNLLHLLAPIARVTGYDIVPPMARAEDFNYPNREKIVKAIYKTMEF
ncbi:alpha-ketoacid dehydrogenase subunit beta [candidate division KSB1 bacterium]|nr:alpha-ketoacid dehydrogenase subunit beta [candidate division KSB1 bacterium]